MAGRAICGIGRGDSSLAKIGRQPTPVAAFERYVAQLQAYLRGEDVDRDGTPSRLEWYGDANVPKVPLEVAATGTRVIEVGARHADRIIFALGADYERLARAMEIARTAARNAGRDPDDLQLGAWINSVVHPDIDAARTAVSGGLAVFAHFSGFSGMKTETMEPSLQKAARDLQTGYDLAGHGKADATHAQALDPEFIDRFGIVGPLEVALPRFERLAQLGLDFCRVIPGSRDAARDVVSSSMMQLASVVRPAVARTS